MALAQQQRERPGSSIAGLIPLLFSFKQKPLEISHRYFLHEPVFKLHGRPRKTTLKASRQIGKSLGLGVDAIFLSSMIPGFKCMAAFPLQSQANWFSTEYLKPLIQDSPLIAERVLRGSDAVGQRSFEGRGAIYMRYIGNGADRARGSACDYVLYDEFQDHDLDAVGVVEQNTAASEYRLLRFSGTPKTTDNVLEQSWRQSSMGIWVIPCRSCGHFNDASPDHELMKMLGDETLVCAKCGVRVDSSLGWYRHKRPERINAHAGYEMPGPCFPHKYQNPAAWFELKEAQRTKPLYMFVNEHLGGSFDGGSKLITPEEVQRAATVPWCEPRDFVPTPYVAQHIGVDWGGKGKQTAASTEEFISNTAVALAALRPDGRVEIPWLYAMPYAASYEEEARITCQAAQLSGAEYIAHDAGGGGDLRQSILENAGWPLGQIAPFTYGNMSASKPIVFFIRPERPGVRVSYTVDKARSLGLLIHLIKTGWVLLPEWARAGQFLEDFQSIFEETRDTPSGAPKRYISRISGRHDDVVHAINFAVMSLYHSSGMWPDVAKSFRAQGVGADEPDDQ